MQQIPTLDIIALVWFALAAFGYGIVTSYRPLEDYSIVGNIQAHRLTWMRTMARRDNRIVDAQLLVALSQGNAFFASTSAIAIGGIAAITGSGDKALAFFDGLPYTTHTSPLLWGVKLMLLIAIFVFAFFKFAWAFRLSHYTAIMIGATPMPGECDPATIDLHASRTAALIGIAAEHTNGGLRSFFYAVAAMAWLFHPLAFMAATTWILGILIRRDFYSRARTIVAG